MPALTSDPSRRQSLELHVVVGELSESEVRPSCVAAPIADPHGARLGEALLDPVPAGVPQVEGVTDRRIHRSEQQLEEAVVPRPLDDDADAAEPVAEAAHALLERREPALDPSGALTANRKPSGTCAAHDRNCSSDGRRYFVAFSSTVRGARVEGEELAAVDACRVEARLPGGIAPARRADVERRSRRPSALVA